MAKIYLVLDVCGDATTVLKRLKKEFPGEMTPERYEEESENMTNEEKDFFKKRLVVDDGTPRGHAAYMITRKRELREKREELCFSIIDRSQLWYDTLTYDQVEELRKWYLGWLRVTETFIIPEKPKWLW